MGYSYVYHLQTIRYSRFNVRCNTRIINEDHKLTLENRTKTYVPLIWCYRMSHYYVLRLWTNLIFNLVNRLFSINQLHIFFLNILLQGTSSNTNRHIYQVNNRFHLCKYSWETIEKHMRSTKTIVSPSYALYEKIPKMQI